MARWSRSASGTRPGAGQVVDASLYESVLAVMESIVPDWEIGGYQRERTGSIIPDAAPSNTYPTADGVGPDRG